VRSCKQIRVDQKDPVRDQHVQGCAFGRRRVPGAGFLAVLACLVLSGFLSHRCSPPRRAHHSLPPSQRKVQIFLSILSAPSSLVGCDFLVETICHSSEELFPIQNPIIDLLVLESHTSPASRRDIPTTQRWINAIIHTQDH
jgi:hypothetical protein